MAKYTPGCLSACRCLWLPLLLAVLGTVVGWVRVKVDLVGVWVSRTRCFSFRGSPSISERPDDLPASPRSVRILLCNPQVREQHSRIALKALADSPRPPSSSAPLEATFRTGSPLDPHQSIQLVSPPARQTNQQIRLSPAITSPANTTASRASSQPPVYAPHSRPRLSASVIAWNTLGIASSSFDELLRIRNGRSQRMTSTFEAYNRGIARWRFLTAVVAA